MAIGATASVCLVALASVAVFMWARSGAVRQSVSKPADYCTVTTSDGNYPLSLTQTRNASFIAAVAVQRGLPDHAATVAIATAMQESKLVNLDHGDLDSVGLFQQRPSQGWGTVEQLMDESYATNAFYDGLVKVADWQTIPVEDAAQAVQRSGYPDLYTQWDGMARAWASALTGEVAAGVTCSIHTKTSPDADGLVTAFRGQFPSVEIVRSLGLGDGSDTESGSDAGSTSTSDAGSSDSSSTSSGSSGATGDGQSSTVTMTLTFTLPAGLSESDMKRQGWQAATWLVAHAHEYGVRSVHACGMDWSRSAGRWSGTEAAEQSLTVTLR
ncbi:cobalt transporter [Bifidobacterium sp. MA2]|uniref:Cobalt transporter n=1 Tax=Bifidobacterium santillanense TaxID=2809028 RepID=A0ABS5ULZ9_9BIFI|nr:cobalt transporter [Bifidobacterium santillanense]